MSIKLKPYVEAIQASDADKEAALAPARAEQTKGELALKIATLELEVKGMEIQVTDAGANWPLDVDSLSEALDSLDIANRRLEQLKGIRDQLFPKT